MINRKHKLYFQPSSQAGFTLIEALLAIIVVTIMMIAISPAIVLSVATRVQAKRVELGTAAAQSYIDGVRSGAIAAPNIIDNSSNTYATPNDVEVPTGGDLVCSPPVGDTPPRKAFYCSTTTTNSYLYCIDNDDNEGCDKDSFKDIIVQAFGLNSDTTSTDNDDKADKGYQLGIRIYRADAFKDSGDLKKSDNTTKREASTFTGGAGDRKAPLVEMTTEIVTSKTKYKDLQERLPPPSP